MAIQNFVGCVSVEQIDRPPTMTPQEFALKRCIDRQFADGVKDEITKYRTNLWLGNAPMAVLSAGLAVNMIAGMDGGVSGTLLPLEMFSVFLLSFGSALNVIAGKYQRTKMRKHQDKLNKRIGVPFLSKREVKSPSQG